MSLLPDHPRQTHTAVIGAGTMGADVAVVLARGGSQVTLVEPNPEQRNRVHARLLAGLQPLGMASRAATVKLVASLQEVDWQQVVLVVECITEQLAPKQALFAQLVKLAQPHAVLASNSSGIPISAIGQGLPTAERMVGLHFFMPAHLVPLVEVVLGPQSAPEQAEQLCHFMRGCGSVPVLVRKDKPGFLANRLQHALSREAFALIDEGIASPEDVDAAVRFGFGFRFLAAGPVLQRDHAGLDVHTAAAATIYPSLCNGSAPAQVLQQHVTAGQLGMKTGAGFYPWPADRQAAERQRYDQLLQKGLALLADELPPLTP